MNMYGSTILGVVIILLWYLYSIRETIRINYIVFLVVNRGILAPNCTWWNISSKLLEDASGVKLYYDLIKKFKKQNRTTPQVTPLVTPLVVPINILGVKTNLVTDVSLIKTVLDNSPFIFGVGDFKYKMFKSFMPGNVGVSEGCEWIQRRMLNTRVLETDKTHQYGVYFDKYIADVLSFCDFPKDFTQFSDISKLITNKIVFNRSDINPDVYKIFSEANSLKALLTSNYQIDPKIHKSYERYLYESIVNPKFPSLVQLSTEHSQNIPNLIQQVPHWIFPIVGLINTSFPRLLMILCNHPSKFAKLITLINQCRETMSNSKNFSCVGSIPYLRQCILETFRLNNPVVTTFRTLLKDFNTGGECCPMRSAESRMGQKYNFKAGDQFLILNNPVLRDPKYFINPNKYCPERWTAEMEDSYYSIMFNQGPQKCPGKDLAIFILESFTVHYLDVSGILKNGPSVITTQEINVEDIPQMINPCDIKFYFKPDPSHKVI